MKLHPPSTEEKLGFDVIRDRLDTLTRSSLGQDRLAGMRPFGSIPPLRAELERVWELQQALRFDDPVPLQHVLDLRDVLRRAAPAEAYLAPEDLVAVRLVLMTVRRLQAYVRARREKYPALAEAVGRITPLPGLEERIAGVVDDEGRVRDDASPELRRLRRLIVQRQAALRETLMRELREAIGRGYATEEQPTIRSGRMVIPVRAEAKRKIEGFVQDVSATGQTVYIEPASVLSLNNEVRELEAEERREVERILRAVTAALREHLAPMRDNLRVLAQFDLLQAKATLANQLDAVVPHLNDEGRIDIRQGRHPVLQLYVQRWNEEHPDADPRRVVPLDLSLGIDYHTLVVTGPNAGGKTVAMKTVGLLTLMLAYGIPVPVDPASRLSLFDRLIVDIGDEQSMEEDLSTFSSHVANLRYMLQHADARTLLLIDEAGTGTDPAEGGALAQAVLEALTRVGARTIATTHHGSLKAFAHETEGVENGSMEFDQATLSPTYRFRAGIPGSSYAFEIAERVGLPRAILDRARALVGGAQVRLEDLIAALEERAQALEARLQEAEVLRRQAEHEKATYAGRLRKLENERDAIRAQALQEAERIVREANARVERTIREIKEAQAEKEATRAARERLERFRASLGARREQDEQRRRVEQARARRSPRTPRPASAEGAPGPAAGHGPIREGDQVVLDDGTAAAEVLEIEGDDALVALGSMKMRVKLGRLRKVGGPRKQQVTVRQTASSGAGLTAFRARTRVDLRGQRVEEALAEVTHLIDDALASNLDRVEILHGKGTGALRQAIHEYLATRPEVASFEEAPWDQGGPGVTYVTLR